MATLMVHLDVSKRIITNVATFDSRLVGHLGIVQDGVAHYHKAPLVVMPKESVLMYMI